MRIVRLLNDMHGLDDGPRRRGEVIEVDDAHAHSWVGRSVAEYADGFDARGRRVDPLPTTESPAPPRAQAAAVAPPAAAEPPASTGSLRRSSKAKRR